MHNKKCLSSFQKNTIQWVSSVILRYPLDNEGDGMETLKNVIHFYVEHGLRDNNINKYTFNKISPPFIFKFISFSFLLSQCSQCKKQYLKEIDIKYTQLFLCLNWKKHIL